MQNPVNISVVTFNRLEKTKFCLESIFRNTEVPFMLTVVDNNSEDGTRDWLLSNAFPISRVVLLNQNIGIAKASNIAWRDGPKAYYVKLDNDIVIEKRGWLRELVELCDNVDKLGVVAYNVEGRRFREASQGPLKFQIKDQGNLGGCSIMIPQRTWEKLGYWCEDYGLYGEEDADYGFRVQKLGLWNVYHFEDEAVVHLPHPRYEADKDDNWYADFKKEKRNMNLEAGSKYHKNINSYTRHGAMRIQ